LEYVGKETVDGEDYNVKEEADPEGKAPFRCVLDVGLRQTTTGARIFGALKGATDGGLDIPHSTRRFIGSKKKEDDGEIQENPEAHKKYILGGHVGAYMKKLTEKKRWLNGKTI